MAIPDTNKNAASRIRPTSSGEGTSQLSDLLQGGMFDVQCVKVEVKLSLKVLNARDQCPSLIVTGQTPAHCDVPLQFLTRQTQLVETLYHFLNDNSQVFE